ncbi:nucleoside-diphosphate sugar epimerase [Paenibacillus sp. sgz302251]|uniref:nucleoside-diphosphate sugar epimerase n=1 Tax=Paenibacillus sp. sgz302251 TaxID=3414493 RepID=UPI003C7AB6E5
MYKSVTEMVERMSRSNYQLARILEANRHVAVRAAKIIVSIPDDDKPFSGVPELLHNTNTVGQSIVNYLNTIAVFQNTIAEQLSVVIRELKEAEQEHGQEYDQEREE